MFRLLLCRKEQRDSPGLLIGATEQESGFFVVSCLQRDRCDSS